MRINPVHALLGLALGIAVVAGIAGHAPGRLVALILAGVVFTAGFAACAIVSSALWPRQIERAHGVLASMPLRCWLLGLLLVVAQIWLVMAAHPARVPVLLAVLLLDLVALAQGLPAVAALVGERLGAPSRPHAVAAGSVLFAATGVLPVVGWLLSGTLILQALGAAAMPSRLAAR